MGAHRHQDDDEDLGDAMRLLQVALEADQEEADAYIAAFVAALRRDTSITSVAAKLARETADAQDRALGEIWRDASRRCAQLAAAHLTDLQAQAQEQARATPPSRAAKTLASSPPRSPPATPPQRPRETGADLAAFRRATGLTEYGVCAMLGISEAEVTRLEAFGARPLPARVAAALVRARQEEEELMQESMRSMKHLLATTTPVTSRRPPAQAPPAQAPPAQPPKQPPPRAPEQPPKAVDPQLKGEDLKRWRTAHGHNQSEAAAVLGVSQGYIAKAEGAPERPLGPTLQEALRQALRTTSPAENA